MSTLSQPQTPASPDSPSKEYRHKFVERLTDRLETPSLDDRKYRVVRLLPNQLEVLLVHDAETDKASAAMDVNVGNFSDEEDMQGMAHAVRIPGSLYPIPFPHCTPETCIRSYTLGTS
jgi:insulysin